MKKTYIMKRKFIKYILNQNMNLKQNLFILEIKKKQGQGIIEKSDIHRV